MTSANKRTKWVRYLFVVLLIFGALSAGTYFLLPNEKKHQLFEALGIEHSDFVTSKELETFVSVRNVSSRKSMLGGKWVIKGQLFNTHETQAIKRVKLMFNFSDGIETAEYTSTISPQNSFGKRFKEKFSGHSSAEFLSIDILEAK